MSKTKITFEQAMEELDLINRKLSNPATPLDEGIKLYQEGLELAKYCMDILSSAKGKITLIKQEFDKVSETPYSKESD